MFWRGQQPKIAFSSRMTETRWSASAYQIVAAGQSIPGLITTTNDQSIGSAIDDILLIAEYMPEEEIKEQVVVYLPFRG
jgi:hypothetical protein